MIGLIQVAVFYALVVAAGARVASRLPMAGRLDRWLIALAWATAQLLVSIQVLSLFRLLTGSGLFWMNAGLAGAVWLATRRWPPAGRYSALGFGSMIAFVRAQPLEATCVIAAVISILGSAVTGGFTHPFGDNYHASMPLFWKQHSSILPFPVYDPRIIGVVFGAEGVGFPGFLYSQHGGMGYAMISALAGLMSLWIVAAVARQLGASARASAGAAAMVAGLGPISSALFYVTSDLLLAGMWFGASTYFLLASRDRATGSVRPLELGCSMLCLALACGTKNIVVLQVPSWLGAAALWHGRGLFRVRPLVVLGACGLAGLLASGVVWSYFNNWRWFGSIKGGRELQETLATEMIPRAIWTRVARSGVTLVLDVIWVPQQARGAYAAACRNIVRLVGGLDRLKDDKGLYTFAEGGPRPGMGLGPMGPIVFIPAVLAGLFRRLRWKTADHDVARASSAAAILSLLTIGSFLTCYVVLKWQSIGTTRLLISCAITGMPLAGLLFEAAWIRRGAMALTLICLGMYGISGLSSALRHLDITDRFWLLTRVARLQQDRALTVSFRWWDGIDGSMRLSEDFTRRQVYKLLFTRLPQPTVIGAIGSINMEGSYLFGTGHSNRVVSLVDSRVPQRLLHPPPEVEFIVVDELTAPASQPEVLRGFDPWLEVTHSGKPLLTAFKRRPMPER